MTVHGCRLRPRRSTRRRRWSPGSDRVARPPPRALACCAPLTCAAPCWTEVTRTGSGCGCGFPWSPGPLRPTALQTVAVDFANCIGVALDPDPGVDHQPRCQRPVPPCAGGGVAGDRGRHAVRPRCRTGHLRRHAQRPRTRRVRHRDRLATRPTRRHRRCEPRGRVRGFDVTSWHRNPRNSQTDGRAAAGGCIATWLPAPQTNDDQADRPDNTAVRVALWRALHVEVDPPPHVFEDEVGLRLVAPDDGWRERPDMDPEFTRVPRLDRRPRPLHRGPGRRAGRRGIGQYVILGAGLDTFAQRRPELGVRPAGVRGRPARNAGLEAPAPGRARLRRARLAALVPIDFEAGESWWDGLRSRRLRPRAARRWWRRRGQHVPDEGGRSRRPFVSSRRSRRLDRGDVVPAAGRAGRRGRPPGAGDEPPRARARRHAVHQLLHAGRDARGGARAGFADARHVPGRELAERYFAGRPDGLRPSTGEDLVVATT